MARVRVTGVKAINSSNHCKILSSSLLEIIILKIILQLRFKKSSQGSEKDIFSLFGIKQITIYNK